MKYRIYKDREKRNSSVKTVKMQSLSDNKHTASLKSKLLVMFREINAAY